MTNQQFETIGVIGVLAETNSVVYGSDKSCVLTEIESLQDEHGIQICENCGASTDEVLDPSGTCSPCGSAAAGDEEHKPLLKQQLATATKHLDRYTTDDRAVINWAIARAEANRPRRTAPAPTRDRGRTP